MYDHFNVFYTNEHKGTERHVMVFVDMLFPLSRVLRDRHHKNYVMDESDLCSGDVSF